MPEPICIFCAAELPHDSGPYCLDAEIPIPDSVPSSVGINVTPSNLPRQPGQLGPPVKDGTAMKDVLSTGRKRAAIAAPIAVGMICEWALLKEAGGGVVPIKGCPGNPASDRHHGPNKSVLDNEVGINLHRICDWCHNRWHTANDQYYGEGRPDGGVEWFPVEAYKEHNPVSKMSKMEALLLEASRNKDK